jgi:hypothetical protein
MAGINERRNGKDGHAHTLFQRIAVSALAAQMRMLADNPSVQRGELPDELLPTLEKYRRIERRARPRLFDEVFETARSLHRLESAQVNLSGPEALFLRGESDAMLECLDYAPDPAVTGATIETVLPNHDIVRLLIRNEADVIVTNEENAMQETSPQSREREYLLGREIGLKWVLGIRKNLLYLKDGRLLHLHLIRGVSKRP